MAELNLNQIIDKLNDEFTGEARKLVFWYDDKADFLEDMQSVKLANAKIIFLQQDNQFYTKHFLECIDTTSNYLVYAPFPKPDVKDNHLEDTLLYSRRFYADRASLLCVDLAISEKYKPLIEKHIKFFASKERTQRYYDLEIENFNEENILIGLLCASCRARTCSFEEVVRVVLTDGGLGENKYLAEFDKYDLSDSFWKLCEQQFGFIDNTPTLEKLLITMFVTYADRYIHADLPKAWMPFISIKSGNIIAFLDNLMNSVLYCDAYGSFSDYVADCLNVKASLLELNPEDIVDCDIFRSIDEIILKWLVDRLVVEDTGAMLNGLSILDICEKRIKTHFGAQQANSYNVLRSACFLISANQYQCSADFSNIIKSYIEHDYIFDQEYRRFYTNFDQMDASEPFEQLQELVENIYTNEYLDEQLPNWNAGILEPDSFDKLPLQRDFYQHFIATKKEKTVVIISDAMRYEVARELFERLQDDPKSTIHMECMLSVLPSYTRLGMAALLPHKTLTIADHLKVLADDISCDSLTGRQKVLQSHCPESECVQFDNIKSGNQKVLRDIFTGRQVVYVYHNQIDARGDKANTEDEVFFACEEAIQEIVKLIQDIASKGNTYHFIVTADHGFIYKREKLPDSAKIGGINDEGAEVNRRFIISPDPIIEDGIESLNLGYLLDNDDARTVSFPVSSNVFKVPGGGQNYVHGGSSPQEMLVPVIDIKMEKGHMETENAKIALVSIVQKITNLITSMDFIQSDPVSDTVKATTYRLFFMAEDGEKISNENILVADSREDDAGKRITRKKFTFKNQRYEKDRQYYLVAYVVSENSEIEAWRHPVIMDLAFGDDFGF